MFRRFTKLSSEGFTLIELLIVIAVLGILAAATLAILDPIDKINAGNDSKVQTDIAAIGKAAEAYAVFHDGQYPANVAALVTSGDLKFAPVPPNGYNAYVFTTTGTPITAVNVRGTLKSKKYTSGGTAATPIFKYTTATGKACFSTTANQTADCP